MAAVRSYHLLKNIDKDAREFIAAYGTESKPQKAPVSASSTRSLAEVVEAGLRGEAGPAVEALLETTQPMEIIDGILIPALDRVGARFETGNVFLPQLIQAAGAAQAAFEVLRTHLAKSDGESVSRGTIILATVKGDIHDIGKNIVRVLLENF